MIVPELNTFLPPSIVNAPNGKKYACPGWIEIDEKTTLDQLLEKWIRVEPLGIEPKIDNKNVYKVLSSKGDQEYTVKVVNGSWTCDCIGFSVRKKCKHVEEIKNKSK